MIYTQTISSGLLHKEPFSWCRIPQFFSEESARYLSSSFPDQYFRDSVSAAGHYQLSDRSVIDEGKMENISDFTPAWKELMEDLLSRDYSQAISTLFGIDLSGTQLKVRLCKYKADCWMLPHTDRVDRVITQIIYLTEGWDEQWGGNLLLLRSDDETDVAGIIPPAFNSSILFMRSDQSWHSVQGVDKSASGTRNTILIQFIRA